MDYSREINEALHRSLREWGVTDDRFQKKILKKGMELASSLSSSASRNVGVSPICFDHLRPNKFPCDVKSAYELTLRTDIESVEESKDFVLYSYVDSLQIDCFGEPYFKSVDKYTGTSTYRLKKGYKGIVSHRLNSLNRYSFEKHTKPSFFFKNWFTDENFNSDMGTYLEACWSCHAIQNESCFNCKSRNSLRWCGGFVSSWQDLVCVECKCMYELKTKASMEKIESTYYHNNTFSGSFSAYLEIERARRISVDDPCSNGHTNKINSGGGPKMFIVMLPRNFTFNRKREKIHPVFIAEIDAVTPKLSEMNFDPDWKSFSFKSRTSMNLRSKTKWFDLPFSDEDVDLHATKKKIYVEYFGQEVFDACSNKGTGAGEETSSTLKVEDGIENGALSKEDLVAKLDNLKINEEADDWDDMYE